MKKLSFILVLIAAILNTSISHAQSKDVLEKAKQEILAAEIAFCKMAKEKSIEEAVVAFAADDAVICRSIKVYKGTAGIHEYYSRKDKGDKLTWKADFVDVSSSGDMGYTYGEYDFEGIRVGKTITDHGTFHTIWKKQKDGNWKFVVD